MDVMHDRHDLPPTGIDPDQAQICVQALKPHYRSGTDDIAEDFFQPCLACCSLYQRAVGFFSSSALATWADVLPRLAANKDNIRIQLLIHPELSPDDLQVLAEAASPDDRFRLRAELADRILLDALTFAGDPADRPLRLRLFSWLIATETLELKFAFADHVEDPGIFHEKIGVFTFPWDATVAFTGSANESRMGHSRNYETLDVYRSWVPEDRERVAIKSAQFAEAWDAQASGLVVIPLSRHALDYVRERAPTSNPIVRSPPPHDLPEAAQSLRWRHQDEAIDAFLEAERGVLEMATGTGKTFTSLRICRHLITNNKVSNVVVTADGTDLLNQWGKQLVRLATSFTPRFSVLRHYHEWHEREQYVLSPNRTFLLISRPQLAPALRALPPEQRAGTLLIHDEVHRLGSPGNRRNLESLSDRVRYRLGLSATPERIYDKEGTDFITAHIGSVIYRFGLEEAIRRGILCPYDYHPLEYEPSEDDRARIQQVYRKAKARKEEGDPMSDEELWTELARVHKTSTAKLPVFEKFIENHPDLLRRCIIFVETKDYGSQVLDIVHRHRYDFHTYYAEEDSETLRRFAVGELECLITCHRLSEGIDIKTLETVILFSSARARLETIQRMGRCLRVDPANPDKRANVIDFVRTSDSNVGDNADTDRCAWLSQLALVRPEAEAP